MKLNDRKQIEDKYFDGEYEELSTKGKLNIVGNELLRIEDEQEELTEKRQNLETLYDFLKEELGE